MDGITRKGLGVQLSDQITGMIPEEGMKFIVPLFCLVLDERNMGIFIEGKIDNIKQGYISSM